MSVPTMRSQFESHQRGDLGNIGVQYRWDVPEKPCQRLPQDETVQSSLVVQARSHHDRRFDRSGLFQITDHTRLCALSQKFN